MLRTTIALILFVVLVVGGGIAIGIETAPGAWYAGLEKPSFTPPNWLFGPVWTVLYIFIAIAGWRVWRHAPLGAAMGLWWAQLAANFLWSPLFFMAHLTGAAFLLILLLLVLILAFIAKTWAHERVSAILFVPYAVWVAYAAALNGTIWLLNG